MPTRTETDDRGAEYLVTTGYGKIKSITWPDEGKQNAHVEIDADGLRIGVKGWADTTDPAINEVLVANPDRVEFRIETHRDKDHDPAIPIADVDSFKKFRRMIVLKPVSGNGNGASGAPAASGNRDIPNEPPAIPGAKENQPTTAPPPPRSGGHLTDTWAYGATLGLAELAFELLVKTGGSPVNSKTVRELADRLLAVADAGQRSVRGEVERNANSHVRARGALRSTFELYPPPLDTPADMDEWQERVTRAVCLLMKVGLDLLEADG